MILNDVGLWTTIGIEMFCGPFVKVFLTFLEHQGVEIFQACFGVQKWQQTRTHKKASSVKCVANHARSIQSRRAESPTNSAWDLSNLPCLSQHSASQRTQTRTNLPLFVNVEFQSDSQSNKASLVGQAFVPVVQTSKPMWFSQEVLLLVEKGGGMSLVKALEEWTRRCWNGCRAVVPCQQRLWEYMASRNSISPLWSTAFRHARGLHQLRSPCTNTSWSFQPIHASFGGAARCSSSDAQSPQLQVPDSALCNPSAHVCFTATTGQEENSSRAACSKHPFGKMHLG